MSKQSIDLEKRLLAAALYELRVLLASHIDPQDKSPVALAANFAYSLHNQALAVLSAQPFDVAHALGSLSKFESQLGREHLQQFRRTVLNVA